MNDSWLRADWPAPADIVAGCTYRRGGVSRDRYESLNLAAHVGDDPAAVALNRERVRNICGLPAEPCWLRQAHGSSVATEPAEGSTVEADASITRRPDVVCAVLTADCLPVLITSGDGTEVAAAHAGWRGLGAGILEATVAAMTARPDSLLAWLGPAISQSAFEVGPEVRMQFCDEDERAIGCFIENARGRWQADLYALARLRLASSGLQHVFGGGFCTHAEAARFFSYRRDGQCGRMASFIFRRLK